MVRAGFEVSLVGPMLRAPLFYIGTDFGGAAGRYVYAITPRRSPLS